MYRHFDSYKRGPVWPTADYAEQGFFTAEQKDHLASKFDLSAELVSNLSLYVGNTLDEDSLMNLTRVSREKAVNAAEEALRRAVRHARQSEQYRGRVVEVLLGCSTLFADTPADAARLDRAQALARDPESKLGELLEAVDAVLECPGSAAILAPADLRKVYDGRREHIVRSCCYTWMEAGRPLTYAMNKGRREGPLFELIWTVMRLVLSDDHRPSDETIRNDIDRFRELVKRRPEILDQR